MGFVWGNITYVITAITLHSTPIPQNASSLISYIFSHLSDTRGPVGIDVRVDFTLYFRHSTIAVSCHLNTCLDTFNGVNTLHLTSFQESFGLIWMTWHAFELLLLHLQYRSPPFHVSTDTEFFQCYGWTRRLCHSFNTMLIQVVLKGGIICN